MTEPAPAPVENDDQGLQEDLRLLARQSRERQLLIGLLTGAEAQPQPPASDAPKVEKPTD